MLKDRGVRTKFDPKMSIISDVRATILVKTADISPKVVNAASYKKYIKLVSSEVAHSIVLAAKISFRMLLMNFAQAYLNAKDWSFKNPFCAKNTVHENGFKFETKTFRIGMMHDIFEKQLFGAVTCAWFCSLTYQKPHNKAFGHLELYSVKDRESE